MNRPNKKFSLFLVITLSAMLLGISNTYAAKGGKKAGGGGGSSTPAMAITQPTDGSYIKTP